MPHSILATRLDALLPHVRGDVLHLSPELTGSGRYDTIVCCGVLCAVDDIDAALGRIDELLAPDGRILLVEHIRAPGLRGRLQDAASVVYRRLPGGCHLDRDVIAALRRNGFAVTDCDRHTAPGPIVGPHVSAIAIRKAQPPMQQELSE